MKKLFFILLSVFTLHLSLFPLRAQAADPLAPVPKTGQTTCYDASGNTIGCAGTGQDGDKQAGVDLPAPRFTDNSNGTVKDNLTGLIWLKNANCYGIKVWNDAVAIPRTLQDGLCGLTDGSSAGQWRLPTVKELESLTDAQNSNPALPTAHPFSSVQSYFYWSSSTFAYNTGNAWYVHMGNGGVNGVYKNDIFYVWPVRSGQ